MKTYLLPGGSLNLKLSTDHAAGDTIQDRRSIPFGVGVGFWKTSARVCNFYCSMLIPNLQEITDFDQSVCNCMKIRPGMNCGKRHFKPEQIKSQAPHLVGKPGQYTCEFGSVPKS